MFDKNKFIEKLNKIGQQSIQLKHEQITSFKSIKHCMEKIDDLENELLKYHKYIEALKNEKILTPEQIIELEKAYNEAYTDFIITSDEFDVSRGWVIFRGYLTLNYGCYTPTQQTISIKKDQLPAQTRQLLNLNQAKCQNTDKQENICYLYFQICSDNQSIGKLITQLKNNAATVNLVVEDEKYQTEDFYIFVLKKYLRYLFRLTIDKITVNIKSNNNFNLNIFKNKLNCNETIKVSKTGTNYELQFKFTRAQWEKLNNK